MKPTPKSAHRDTTLANISIAYKNTLYIADRVFLHVPVQHQTDYYYYFTKGAWFRNDASWRAAGARARRGGYVVGDTQYVCREIAMAHPIPVELINNADSAIRPWITGVNFATDKVMLNKEKQVSDLCMTSGNWTTSEDVEAGWNKSNGANSTFIADVLGAKNTVRKLIGRWPNVLVVDAGTFEHIQQDANVLDRIKYGGEQGNPAMVTPNMIAQLFGLDEVLVGGALYSDAEETVADTDFSAVDLWEVNSTKGSAFLFYRPPAPALEVPAAGYVFEWNGGAGQESRVIKANQYRSVRYWWEDAEKQWVVEASENFDPKATGADAGYLFYDTLTT